MLKEAVIDYINKRANHFELVATTDGYFRPFVADSCPLCRHAQWSSRTGSHLKSIEHHALKYDVSKSQLRKAIDRVNRCYVPGTIAYKSLAWRPNVWKLFSPTIKDYVWEPGMVIEASCDATMVHDYFSEAEHGSVPSETCSCGIYTYWSPLDALQYQEGNIVAQMQIGGDVIEYELGSRCQYAKITGIYNQDRPIDFEMALNFGIPLVELEGIGTSNEQDEL